MFLCARPISSFPRRGRMPALLDLRASWARAGIHKRLDPRFRGGDEGNYKLAPGQGRTDWAGPAGPVLFYGVLPIFTGLCRRHPEKRIPLIWRNVHGRRSARLASVTARPLPCIPPFSRAVPGSAATGFPESLVPPRDVKPPC